MSDSTDMVELTVAFYDSAGEWRVVSSRQSSEMLKLLAEGDEAWANLAFESLKTGIRRIMSEESK